MVKEKVKLCLKTARFDKFLNLSNLNTKKQIDAGSKKNGHLVHPGNKLKPWCMACLTNHLKISVQMVNLCCD